MTTYIAEDYDVLEDGPYPATLVEVEDNGERGDYGPFIVWHFDADGGELGTVRVSERSGTSFKGNGKGGTKARTFYEGVLGRQLAKGEEIDFDLIAGTPVTLKVVQVVKPKGTFNKIVAVARRRQPQPVAPQPGTPTVAPTEPRPGTPEALPARLARLAQEAQTALFAEGSPVDDAEASL